MEDVRVWDLSVICSSFPPPAPTQHALGESLAPSNIRKRASRLMPTGPRSVCLTLPCLVEVRGNLGCPAANKATPRREPKKPGRRRVG